MSILDYDFMQRALLAALVTGMAAPAVGTYLVQRRLALLGDGIGHVAVTGVALGLLTGWAPGAIADRPGAAPEPWWDVVANRTPARRVGTGDDVAAAVLFFCLPENSFTTGQTLLVDGALDTFLPLV